MVEPSVVVPLPFGVPHKSSPHPLDRYRVQHRAHFFLFWDKFGAMLTQEQAKEAYRTDELVAQAVDSDLIEFIDPDSIMDERMVTDFNLALAATLEMIERETPDILQPEYGLSNFEIRDEGLKYSPLISYARMGTSRLPSLALENIHAMDRLGLALLGQKVQDARGIEYFRASYEGASLIAALHATFLRDSAQRTLGLSVYPTLQSRWASSLWPPPQLADAVVRDIEVMAPDLRMAPIPDIIKFRRDHGPEFRAYMANVRRYTTELARLDAEARAEAIGERRALLEDAAERLSTITRRYWQSQAVTVSTGAAVLGTSMAAGDSLVSALVGLAATAAAVALQQTTKTPITPFTYLLDVKNEYF